MSKRKELDYLKDILSSANRISSYTQSLDYNDFLSDEKTQDAVVRNLEIIGEATKNILDKTRETYSSIPWKNMAGMRDKLIHDYFGLNIDIVWGVVSEDIDKIIQELEDIISKYGQDD